MGEDMQADSGFTNLKRNLIRTLCLLVLAVVLVFAGEAYLEDRRFSNHKNKIGMQYQDMQMYLMGGLAPLNKPFEVSNQVEQFLFHFDKNQCLINVTKLPPVGQWVPQETDSEEAPR